MVHSPAQHSMCGDRGALSLVPPACRACAAVVVGCMAWGFASFSKFPRRINGCRWRLGAKVSATLLCMSTGRVRVCMHAVCRHRECRHICVDTVVAQVACSACVLILKGGASRAPLHHTSCRTAVGASALMHCSGLFGVYQHAGDDWGEI